MEVERQADAEESGGSDRHVRVTGEVEVDLKAVGGGRGPGFTDGHVPFAGGGEPEESGGDGCEVVGQHDLLEQAGEEDGQADREVHPALGAESAALELRQHLLVVDDGAGDELGEESDEEQVVDEMILLGFPAPGVRRGRRSAGK